MSSDKNMSLTELLELSRGGEMTVAEATQQRVSFAFGTTHIENSNVTREMVEGAERLRATSRARDEAR